MSKENPVVRAIDVGYGNTKYISAVNGREYVPAYFPSIVHRPVGQKEGSFPDGPGIYPVEVNGKLYQVGPGLDAALEGDVRVLHDNFIGTDDYMALVYGALSQMDAEEIDLLVVGLPVDLMDSKKAVLEAKLTGAHSVGSRTFIIHRVNAVAQPLGGFLNFASQHNILEEIVSTRNLLIDPGFFTVDFIVSTGFREIKGRSGSHSSGVSAYIKAVAEELSRDLKINYDNLSHIDQGIRSGVFRLYSEDIDLTQYHKKALTKIMPAVEAISNKIGDGRNIDKIVLVGGGADLFLPLITDIFPKHTISCDDQSIVANVLGFQMIGESWLADNRRRVA